MENRRFKEGTIIKGKDLKGCILCKVISKDMMMGGFQYKMGMNVDVNQLAVKGSCKAGLHFCLIKDICNYLYCGTNMAVVKIPDDEDVYVDSSAFRTHRLEIQEIMPLDEIAAWKYLCENGADITAWDNDAVRRAARHGCLEIVKYLHEKGADITAYNNYAVCWAARNGFLEIVKYLYTNGADITAKDNYAVRYAASCGYIEVVKYLHENGADITAKNNNAVRWAAYYGEKDIVKYLKENMH